MTLAEADRLRALPGRAVLLYLTDHCPVGCDHCSVDALARRRPAADQQLLARLVNGLCTMPGLRLVGISGGEPFAARRALESATAELAAAAKQLVLYTSGHWGRDDGTAPRWTRAVLARTSCVVLSTDDHHAARIPDRRYLAALRATDEAGAWIAVQVLDTPAQTERARHLLATALGPSWRDRAEIRRIPLLARGRAAHLVPAAGPGRPGRSFGACPLATSPVVRYDGRLTACCNEDVITGHGPAQLHSSARDAREVHERLRAREHDTYLRAIARVGPGRLTLLPAHRDLGERRHQDICSLCWALLERGADRDPAVRAIGLTVSQNAVQAAAPRPGRRSRHAETTDTDGTEEGA
ncbi:hypothetical protein [Streptomyces cellulosae]|uniref:Radical SAM protein n=1 Tax=Streptomyces cellulosae TaxID=1968 RepID=A0ABW7Y984_STRCE